MKLANWETYNSLRLRCLFGPGQPLSREALEGLEKAHLVDNGKVREDVREVVLIFIGNEAATLPSNLASVEKNTSESIAKEDKNDETFLRRLLNVCSSLCCATTEQPRDERSNSSPNELGCFELHQDLKQIVSGSGFAK